MQEVAQLSQFDEELYKVRRASDYFLFYKALIVMGARATYNLKESDATEQHC